VCAVLSHLKARTVGALYLSILYLALYLVLYRVLYLDSKVSYLKASEGFIRHRKRPPQECDSKPAESSPPHQTGMENAHRCSSPLTGQRCLRRQHELARAPMSPGFTCQSNAHFPNFTPRHFPGGRSWRGRRKRAEQAIITGHVVQR